MAGLKTIGNTNWRVLICSAVRLDGSVYKPPIANNEWIVYIKCKEVPVDKGYQVFIDNLPYGGNYLVEEGIKCQKVSIDGIIVNATTDLDYVVKALDDAHKNFDPIYCFIYYPNTAAAGTYHAFPFTDSSFAHKEYLKCVVSDCKYVLKAGGVYDIKLQLEEVM